MSFFAKLAIGAGVLVAGYELLKKKPAAPAPPAPPADLPPPSARPAGYPPPPGPRPVPGQHEAANPLWYLDASGFIAAWIKATPPAATWHFFDEYESREDPTLGPVAWSERAWERLEQKMPIVSAVEIFEARRRLGQAQPTRPWSISRWFEWDGQSRSWQTRSAALSWTSGPSWY